MQALAHPIAARCRRPEPEHAPSAAARYTARSRQPRLAGDIPEDRRDGDALPDRPWSGRPAGRYAGRSAAGGARPRHGSYRPPRPGYECEGGTGRHRHARRRPGDHGTRADTVPAPARAWNGQPLRRPPRQSGQASSVLDAGEHGARLGQVGRPAPGGVTAARRNLLPRRGQMFYICSHAHGPHPSPRPSDRSRRLAGRPHRRFGDQSGQDRTQVDVDARASAGSRRSGSNLWSSMPLPQTVMAQKPIMPRFVPTPAFTALAIDPQPTPPSSPVLRRRGRLPPGCLPSTAGTNSAGRAIRSSSAVMCARRSLSRARLMTKTGGCARLLTHS